MANDNPWEMHTRSGTPFEKSPKVLDRIVDGLLTIGAYIPIYYALRTKVTSQTVGRDRNWPKPGKPPGNLSANKPICLLDKTAKSQEKIILNRLEMYTEGAGGLSVNQFGLQKRRSSIDAILSVMDTTKVARRLKRRSIRYCALITLDQWSPALLLPRAAH